MDAKRFEKSLKMADEWRCNNPNFVGLINWEMYDPNWRFKVECWSHAEHGNVIFQIYPDGKGFVVYTIIDPERL